MQYAYRSDREYISKTLHDIEFSGKYSPFSELWDVKYFMFRVILSHFVCKKIKIKKKQEKEREKKCGNSEMTKLVFVHA